MTHDSLLLDLYACAAEPQRWSGVLDRLCLQTGACSAVVQAFSFDGPQARIHWHEQDSRTGQQHALYEARIANSGNPRLEPRRALRGLNRMAGDDELFDPGDDAKSRLQQQLTTLGLGQFIGTLQEVCRGTYLGLALHRAAGDGDEFSPGQTAMLAALAPHIGQAFVLGSKLQTAQTLDARLRRHFDGLRCGLVVCGADASVQWLNRSAEVLLAGHGALRLHAGSLRAHTLPETAALRAEIAAAAAQAGGTAVRYLPLGQHAQALHVAMQAMAPAAGGEVASVLLVVTAADACGDVPTQALVRLFGLTPAESGLVGAMVTGSTVEQYAQHRGVSVGTARGQLKQVLAKTGAARQAELVRLVLSSAAAQFASASTVGTTGTAGGR